MFSFYQEGENMAQPYKGDRSPLSAKIPRADALKLAKVVKLTGESRSELVSRLLHDHLLAIDIDSLAGQEALPIAKAS
ncbi:hypothetical protein [Arthrobacter sp. MP_2.3]|uniref:hypothetical protein n=1 Tax=Arthrobacter sp. MP_2.3 TaxID=3349633 RepID=UPI0038D4DAEF